VKPENTGQQAEDSARSEALKHKILATIPLSIVQVDLAGTVLYGNPAYHKILGYGDGELVGTSILDRVESEEERKSLRDYLSMVAKDQPSPTPYFTKSRTKNGSMIDLRVDWNYDWDTGGNVIAHTSVLTDITAQKRAEEALQESRALLDSFFAVAPVGMALFDAEMRYVTLNGSLAEINGLSIEDHLHKRPRDILPGELGLAVEEKFQQLLRTGQSIISEEISGETLSRPGVTRHWLHSYFPIFGVDERPKGIGVTLIEITDIKIVEEQLRQSQKMEALGTLSGGIAHDFNNILYPIFIYANLLLEKFATDSEEYTDLTEIIGAADRARDLVSQILVFGRRSDNIKSVCDLVPVAEEAMKLVRAAVPATITIEEKMPSDSVPVFCDSSQIYQVLVNICTNAAQAISDHGKIEIALEATEIEGIECFDGTRLRGSHARLAVTDSGVGMDKGTLAKIFDPFFTTRKVGQGTGLGLSTAFGIVHAHGGGITVSSRPHKGTTFEIFLPLADGIIEKLPATPDHAQDKTGTEKILFVDDEESIRNLGKYYLERLGYSVTTISDGRKALELFKASPDRFNLVVTDQTMPKITGEELARELLKLSPDIPIIVCTGYSSSISPESSSAIGISALLQKPLTPDELSRVVRDVLDQAKNSASGKH
jgi:PAS domain S-box-containing protein